jgi:hypothetical protein
MRLPTLALAALLAAVLVTPSLSATAPGGNLLANPGFEERRPNHEWMPAAWDTFPSNLGTVFFGRDTLAAHGGRYSVNVASVSSHVPMWHNWSQSLILGSELWDKDLVFSIWTKTVSLEGRGYILAQAFNDTIGRMAIEWKVPRDTAMSWLGYVTTGQPIVLAAWKRLYFSENETDWVQREVRMHVPRGANVATVRGGIFGTGQIFFDDASLTAAPPIAPHPVPLAKNLLADPSFEGSTNEWELSIPPFPGLTIERDSTVARFGQASMHVSPSGAGAIQVRSGIGQTLDGRPLAGKRVRLTAWVKAESLQSVAYVSVRCTTPGGEVLGPPSRQLAGTFDWKELTYERDVPPDCQVVGAYLEFNAPASGQLYYDDASLEVVGPADYVKKKLPAPKPAPLPTPVFPPRRHP